MGLKIVAVHGDYTSVKIALTTDAGEHFFAVIDNHAITFMSDESSSGGLYGAPIVKTADDLLDWFGQEGRRKPFRERKRVVAKKVR